MTKEITVNAPEGTNVEIMQTISQPADLEVGPVSYTHLTLPTTPYV